MSCLLLSRLIVSVKKALSVEVNITKVVCWSNSKIALWRIKSVNKKWKVWVENRLSEIRENIGVDCWRYVECNPADIATRCNKNVKFNEVLLFKGVSFWTQDEKGWPRCDTIGDISENADEKEVIVATNLTSIPQAVDSHSHSFRVITTNSFHSFEFMSTRGVLFH